MQVSFSPIIASLKIIKPGERGTVDGTLAACLQPHHDALSAERVATRCRHGVIEYQLKRKRDDAK